MKNIKSIITIILLIATTASTKAQILNTKVVADYRPASSIVTFSPDNKYMVTAGWQGVRIYKFRNAKPKLIKTIKDHSSFVSSVCFSTDGKYLASGSDDKTVKIYSVSDGSFSLLKTLTDHSDEVYSVSFSSDGKYLATGSRDKTVKIYSVSNGSFSLLKTLTDHSNYVESVSFSSDSKYLVSGSWYKTVKIYSVSNGSFSLLKTLTEHKGWIYSVSFSSDGKYLASGGYDGLIVYRLTEILQPAILSIKNSTFIDANKNGILEAGENAQLSINIKNYGKGKANNLKCFTKVSPSISGLSYSLPSSVNIAANGEQTINIPISTNIDLPTKNISIKVSFTETNGFQPAPVSFNITTQAMAKAKLVVSSYNTQIKKQSLSNIDFIVKNNGFGIAENVKIKFTLPANVYASNKLEYSIGSISAKSKQIQPFSFLVTANYKSKTLPIKVSVTEKYAKFGQNKTFYLKVTEGGIVVDNTKPVISIHQPITENSNTQSENQEISGSITSKNPLQSIKINDVPITTSANFSHTVLLKTGNNSFRIVVTDKKGKSMSKTININRLSKVSNIDTDIPNNYIKKPNTYALVIGNENYSGNISNVPYAINDANIFRQYLIKTIGLPANNITLLKNASVTSMSKEIKSFIYRQEINPEAEFIFYYSGHGTNDDHTKTAYLLPSDIEDNGLNKFAVSIPELYNDLARHKTKRVTIFLDACFSGLGRGENIEKGSKAGGGRVPKSV